MEEILEKLKSKARPDQREGMTRYGIVAERRLGVLVPDMRKMLEKGSEPE